MLFPRSKCASYFKSKLWNNDQLTLSSRFFSPFNNIAAKIKSGNQGSTEHQNSKQYLWSCIKYFLPPVFIDLEIIVATSSQLSCPVDANRVLQKKRFQVSTNSNNLGTFFLGHPVVLFTVPACQHISYKYSSHNCFVYITRHRINCWGRTTRSNKLIRPRTKIENIDISEKLIMS